VFTAPRIVLPLLFGLCAAAPLGGCVSGLGGDDYGRYAVGVPASVYPGTLIGYEPVRIEGSRSGAGALSGAALAGGLGSTVGNSTAEGLAAGLGLAVVGGLLGAAIEEGVTGADGFRYTIELEDGRTIALVQADAAPVAPVGSRVRVEYGDRVRVLPAY